MELALAGLGVALGWGVGGVIGGVVGIGGAMTAIPLLSLFLPTDKAILISSIVGMYATLHLAVAYRAGMTWPDVRDLAIGALPGCLLGCLVLKLAPMPLLQIMVSSIIVLFLAMQGKSRLTGLRLPEGRAIGLCAGGVCGVFNSSIGMSGAPLSIYALLRGWSPDRARGNMTLFYVFANSGSLIGQVGAGLFDATLVLLGLVGIAGCALGQIVGLRLGRRVDKELFRRLVLAFLAVSAAIFLVRGLSALF